MYRAAKQWRWVSIPPRSGFLGSVSWKNRWATYLEKWMGRKTYWREKEVCLKVEITREKERERQRERERDIDFPKILTFFWTFLAPLLDHTRCNHCNLTEMRKNQQQFLARGRGDEYMQWVPKWDHYSLGPFLVGDLRELLSAWDVKLGNFGKRKWKYEIWT